MSSPVASYSVCARVVSAYVHHCNGVGTAKEAVFIVNPVMQDDEKAPFLGFATFNLPVDYATPLGDLNLDGHTLDAVFRITAPDPKKFEKFA